jgi:hypothetical protein
MKKQLPEARIALLEKALEESRKKANGWERAYTSIHRDKMRLITMLLDVGVPVERVSGVVKMY